MDKADLAKKRRRHFAELSPQRARDAFIRPTSTPIDSLLSEQARLSRKTERSLIALRNYDKTKANDALVDKAVVESESRPAELGAVTKASAALHAGPAIGFAARVRYGF